MSRRPAQLGTVLALALVIAVACHSDRDAPSGVTTVPEPSLAKAAASMIRTVSVTPASSSIAAGGIVQLTATARDQKKNVVSTTFVWASSAPSIATVSSSGLVTGIAPGGATISATAGGRTGSAAVTVTGNPPPPPVGEVLIAAGDIASCASTGDEATAAVVSGISGTVAVLGDNVYENGTATEFANCYNPSWGAFKSRTKPSVGNHEFNTAGATGYYGYFGAAAGDPAKGYYSYDLGDWHVVVLNSNCTIVACAAGSPQEQWLRADLAATSKACVVAYWHHPRFNSGASHGNDTAVAPFWNALYAAGAELILNGHEHIYERFAPQTPAAVADANAGIREFIVGTGGRSLYTIGSVQPNSEVRNASTYGVLKLTLGAGTYTWEFKPVAGQSFTDSGTGSCH
ncbi:MAG: Ig-like domain-containing protein [Gemmatimonadaceae bacterium]